MVAPGRILASQTVRRVAAPAQQQRRRHACEARGARYTAGFCFLGKENRTPDPTPRPARPAPSSSRGPPRLPPRPCAGDHATRRPPPCHGTCNENARVMSSGTPRNTTPLPFSPGLSEQRFRRCCGASPAGALPVGCRRAFEGGARPPAGNWPWRTRFTHTKA